MAARDHNDGSWSGDEQPSRLGYIAAVFVSALGHVAIVVFVLFVAPRYLHSDEPVQIAYTVKIVDNIPAGDLGTHLPKMSAHKQAPAKAEPPKVEEPKVKVEPPKPIAADDDKEAIALNTKSKPTVTETPTPEPTPAATLQPTPEPTVNPTPAPSKSPKPRATPTPGPKHGKGAKPKPGPTIAIAKAEATPSVEERMAALKRNLMAEHLKNRARHPDEDEDDEDTDEAPDTSAPRGGGPVAGKVASAGKGRGIGGGTGSEGIQQDLDFLLYYQTVQDRIKQAWTFVGGSPDLTATVEFAIGPDGALTAAKIGKSSNDSAYDDSVIRAIRRAAPFPPPPEKFRDRFATGIEALFKLGELKS